MKPIQHALPILLALPLLSLGAFAAGYDDHGRDRDFVQQAARSGTTEIEASKLALQRAHDRDIKAFARRMIADHGKLARELKASAASQGIRVRNEKADPAVMVPLRQTHGREFDAAYVDAVIKGHEEAVALFGEEADSGDNRRLQALARRALPTIRHHLEMARELPGS